MSYIYLTSDLHFGHHNVIEFEDRPYDSIDTMNKKLIDNINSRVKLDDTLINLGDWCFTGGNNSKLKAIDYEKQINGKVIHIKGNHDKGNSLKHGLSLSVIKHSGVNMLLQHEPVRDLREFVFKDIDLVLCGHIHSSWKHAVVKDDERDLLMINVGVDVWNYKPVRIDEVTSYYWRLVKRKDKSEDSVYYNGEKVV